MSKYDEYLHYLSVGMSLVIKKKMLDFELNEYDTELSGIFYDSNLINKSFETMSMICSLLDKIPSKDFFDEREILEDNYLKYHIENYLVCSISMLDKLSKLLNVICKLGINDKDCSFKKIINNKLELLPNEIQLNLKELDKKTQKLRNYRNHVIHKGEFNDEDWFMFSGLSFFSRRSELSVPDEQLRGEVKKEYKKYFDQLSENNKVLFESVADILGFYSQTIKELSDTTINSWPEKVKNTVIEELKNK